MKKKLLALLALGFVAGVTLLGKTNAQNLTDLYLTIQGGNLTIFSTGSFNFGTVTLSSAQQTLSGQMVDYMGVEDLKSNNSGYYTSLSVTNMSGVAVPSNYIPANNVYIKVNGNTITTLSGTTNPRVALGLDYSSYVDLGSVRTFLKRDAAANFGVTGKYGVLPRLQVVVPAYQAVDTYHGVLTYTLYDLGV